MDQETYNAWTRRLRENPKAAHRLVLANRALTTLGYVAFPALVACQCAMGEWHMAVRTVVTAGVGFGALSGFRALVNAPRPYETLDIEPLIKKDTQGRSFPSRHTFSMFMIAFCWLAWFLPAGIALTATGVAIAITRVLAGVHWPRDVVAACAFAALCAAIGFIFVP